MEADEGSSKADAVLLSTVVKPLTWGDTLM